MPSLSEHAAKLRQAFQAVYSEHARLLRIETALGQDALIVERMQGREAINENFEFVIDCVAPSAQFELKRLIGEPLTLKILRPDGSTRAWHGHTLKAAFLGADGGVARYRLHLGPWLAFTARRRNTLVFQDCDVRDIIERIFADYPQANFQFDVTQTLPKRALCTQYRETDLEFVQRLLAEEGLSYCFTHDQNASAADTQSGQTADQQLRIFDSKAPTPDVAPANIRFHRVSAVETEDGITAFRPAARLTTNSATLSAWDALQVQAHAANAGANTADLPPLEHYNGARTGPRYQDPAVVQQSSEHTLAATRLQAKTASGNSAARQLAAGRAFTLTEHASDNGRYKLLAVEHVCANNLGAHLAHLLDKPDIEAGSYRNRFVCVPEATGLIPRYLPKPTTYGPESALVVGINGQHLTSERNHRVKVQFPWQRGTAPNPGGLTDTHSRAHPDGNAPGDETAGIWVRIAGALAGPNWGTAFTPRIGSEVLIDYLDADIDQPVITGQIHNGQDAPPFAAGVDSAANHPGTISGIHTQGLEGDGHNQWVLDDAPGQLRQRLATSQANSELNLGYLIDQNGSTRGAYRGQGAELATHGWAALRAPQGLLLSSTARERGTSAAQDVNESVAQLHAAKERAATLSDAASAQQASALNANKAQTDFIKTIDPEQDGVYKQNVGGQDFNKHKPGTRDKDKPAERFATPSVLLDSPSSIAATTPASSLHYAGGNTHVTTQGETQHSAAATHSSISGSTTSLFTHEGGAKAVAANGPLSLQAHDDKLEILADDSVTVTSSKEKVNIFAQSKITLTSGQSSVTLDGGNITFACPGTFTVKGGTHSFVGPASEPAQTQALPTGTAHIVKAAFQGAANPFVKPAAKDEAERQHSECDTLRLQRDSAKNDLDLLISQQQVFLGADVAGILLDAESVRGIGTKMIRHYGQFGLAPQAEDGGDVSSFLGEKAMTKGSGADSLIKRSQSQSLARLKSAKKQYEDFSEQAHQCETNIVARRQAAAEQKKNADAMDFLEKKNALERDISTLALAAALTNSGTQLTHQDFEYQKELVLSQGNETEQANALKAYNGPPYWDSLSTSAQQGATELDEMVPSSMGNSGTGVMLPPPTERESILENLRTKRDAIESYYDKELRPIWSEVLDYWTKRSGGIV